MYFNNHHIYEKREREYSLSFYKKKKNKDNDKEKEKDLYTNSDTSILDNVTAKSNEDALNHNMKIRINFNILSKEIVKN